MTEKQRDALIADIKTSIAKTHDLVLKLEAHVTGENPVRDTIAYWCRAWKERYGVSYDVMPGDAKQLRRLIVEHGGEEMHKRIDAFFSDRDRFIIQNKHPLGFFLKRAQNYASTAPPQWIAMEDDHEPAPIDCKHEPPCRTDAEHTRKRMSELRA